MIKLDPCADSVNISVYGFDIGIIIISIIIASILIYNFRKNEWVISKLGWIILLLLSCSIALTLIWGIDVNFFEKCTHMFSGYNEDIYIIKFFGIKIKEFISTSGVHFM